MKTGATYNFAKPDQLSPALDTPEDEDSYISYREVELTNDQTTLAFGMGKRTGTYSFRVYSDENLKYYIRCYTYGTITISAKGNNILNKITFTGDMIDLTPDTGTLTDGVWTGNAKTVTFNIESANNLKSVNVEYTPKSSVSIDDDDTPGPLQGDVNYDGRVSISDVAKVVRIILEMDEE